MKGRGVGGCHIHAGNVMSYMTSLHPSTHRIMPLSPESRKGCSSVGSIDSEREQLTPKSSPTQVKANVAVLQSSVVFILFFFSSLCCLPHQLLRVIYGAFREETDSATAHQTAAGLHGALSLAEAFYASFGPSELP